MATFGNLSSRLTETFKNLRTKGKLSAADVDGTVREIRRALLEADVSIDVVKDFTSRVRERALGDEVNKALHALFPDPEERAEVRTEIINMRLRFRHDKEMELIAKRTPRHLVWQDETQIISSKLAPLAVRLLSQVSSSSACKRCWSNYGFIHSSRR